MCETCQDQLSFRDLHDDPLTRAMMDSDGVSRDELQSLLAGVRATLMARAGEVAAAYPAYGHKPGRA